ncbi:hypothetical protein HK104_002836 [Borealophlyctis nickersoniae]|nr:hypothetical protein HK104_002836 [Borealophlyctis nickersoniae]
MPDNVSNASQESFSSLQSKREVVESLEALKWASLQALNSLVRQLVDEERIAEHPAAEAGASTSERPAGRPRSASISNAGSSSSEVPVKKSPSYGSLLDIAEKAKEMSDGQDILAALNQSAADRETSGLILSRSSDMLSHLVEEAVAHGSPAQNAPVPQENGLDVLSDHGLALALAALCNGLYQFLELQGEGQNDEEGGLEMVLGSGPDAATNGDAAVAPAGASSDQRYTNLVAQVSNVQHHRTSVNVSALSEQQRNLWQEIDRLMMLVQTVCALRRRKISMPPTYEEALKAFPRDHKEKSKNRASSTSAISVEELGRIVDAIDRVMTAAPPFDDQSVALSSRQQRLMSAAQLSALIQRLNRGKEKFQDQRADPSTSKFNTLHQLVDQITAAGQRSLSNQRVEITPGQRKRMEIGRMGSVLDRQEKFRFHDQDWISKEQRLLSDLTKLHDELMKAATTSRMLEQRYHLTPQKQKNMYMNSLGARVGRLEEWRMDNQDAYTANQKRDMRFEEIEKVLDRMTPPLQEQRAVLTVRSRG